MALVLAMGSAAFAYPWDNAVLYETDFEAPAYATGDLVPQQGWTEDWDSGTHTNRGQVVASTGYGQALYNYRPTSSQQPNRDYHSLGTVVDSGVATLSWDARRVDTPLSTTWFNVVDSSNNQLTAVGMEVPSSTAGFRVHRWDGSYGSFGSLAWNAWYRLHLEMRFSGPGAGTYDLIARGPDGSLAAQLLNEPFKAAGTQPEFFRVRTYGTGSGIEVDNIRYEDGKVLDKVMHGDFDRLEAGSRPDDGAPVGGWSTADGSGSPDFNEGADVNRLRIDPKPGTTDDLALHVIHNVHSVDPAEAQQIFATPYTEGPHKLIMMHEQVTVAGKCGADVRLATGPDAGDDPVTYGLRTYNDSTTGAYMIRHWAHSGAGHFGTWTPGSTYEFRTSVDLETDTYDLYVRSPDDADGKYQRWTQIGKQAPFQQSGDKTSIDRVRFGQYYRVAESYVDNVSAFSSADLPAAVLCQNSFESYSQGGLLGQDGWTVHWDHTTDPAANRCQIVTDPVGGKVAAVTATTAGSGSPTGYTALYQDLDCVADFGDVIFNVDARWTGGSANSDYAYFALGDSDLLNGSTSFAPAAGLFGFRQGKFMVRPGDGSGGYGVVLSPTAADPNTWYHLTATFHTTGDGRNTWDLAVRERDTDLLLWSYTGARFGTDYTDITRLGMFVYDINAATPGTLYFDNLKVNVPEPATLVLLGGGLLALARRRRRR